jgi:hypothetical protein
MDVHFGRKLLLVAGSTEGALHRGILQPRPLYIDENTISVSYVTLFGSQQERSSNASKQTTSVFASSSIGDPSVCCWLRSEVPQMRAILTNMDYE